MRANMKKLAMYVAVFSVVMFMTVATASAGDQIWKKSIEGEYAVTGGGACVSCDPGAIDITNDNFFLTKCGGYSPDVVEGVYKFHRNGTGTFKGKLGILIFATGGPLFGASADTEWTFNYSVAADGDITFTDTVQTTMFTSGPPFIKGSSSKNLGGPLHGRISSDQGHLTVTCGPIPIEAWPRGETPVITGDPDGSQMLCIINLAGHRK
jgi:hypothetical protein